MKEPYWMLQNDGGNKWRWTILLLSVAGLIGSWIIQIFDLHL